MSGWRTARGTVRLDRPVVMGILNLTPDSFWSGSQVTGALAAAERAGELLYDGADLIDLGGESTRPGAAPVEARDELERVLPAVEAILAAYPDALISVDTVKASVARAALEAGAAAINDVSGLRLDEELAGVVSGAEAGLVVMHSRGEVGTMASYELATYGADPVGEIVSELASARERARSAGVADEAIVLDPGLGFSKRTEHSVALLRDLHRVVEIGSPVLVGVSRKRFVGELGGGIPVEERLPGTLAAAVVALLRGARIFRVHDVGPIRRALDVADALRRVS